MESFNIRFNQVEEKISKLEERIFDTIQEQKRI